MKVIAAWKGFVDSLGTAGGSLLLLTVILLAFFPMLAKNDSEAWKAAMFVLGAIAGLINNNRPNHPTGLPPTTPPPVTTLRTTAPDDKKKPLTMLKG